MERASQSTIESEIADLTRQIESKRRALEAEKGIIEEKELVRDAVGEKISSATPSFASNTKTVATTAKKDSNVSYLDSVDEQTSGIVNGLLEIVFSKSIDEAVMEAEKQDAFIMDAFHDALTDKMYEELKKGGIVK